MAGNSDPGIKLTSQPHHLNSTGCKIQYTQGKGRGVFASRHIPFGTIVEISPVLLFQKEEYASHGRHTILDHYTFKWRGGQMALALGLGSLFNHSESPNILYKLDFTTESISYKTTRAIEPDEELCIFYGHNLWFRNVDRDGDSTSFPMSEELSDNEWGGLSCIDVDTESERLKNPFEGGSPDEVIAEEFLPFQRYTLPPEEETLDTIRTLTVWVIDIADPRDTSAMLKWLKQNKLDDELGHLKRVKKHGFTSTMLLTAVATLTESDDRSCPLDLPPQLLSLPQGLSLSAPYTMQVPSSVALTPISHQLKNTLWPTVFAPKRKDVADQWTRGKAKWAWDAVQVILHEAAKARESGEVPVVSHVRAPYENAADPPLCFTSNDTRNSANHPLRHAVVNVIRQVADYRGPCSLPASSPETNVSSTTSPTPSPSLPLDLTTTEPQNGSHYLLTSFTLFTTHEPCIMCSMSLLHSRVKEVIFLYPMNKTGGCGGAACLPFMKGVNHRFGVLKWTLDISDNVKDLLRVDEDLDA